MARIRERFLDFWRYDMCNTYLFILLEKEKKIESYRGWKYFYREFEIRRGK